MTHHQFTYRNYKSLLQEIGNKYDFTTFSKIKYSNEQLKNKVLIRHDIDLSLEKAVEMSEIEFSLKITTVYFLFLRSPFYNIFSHEEESLIRILIKHGHQIGLHFDFAKYSEISTSQMSFQIMREIKFMQDFYGIKLDAVSFHRPLSLDFFSKLELAHYPHTYEPIFVKNFKYLSDSRGLWRMGHPIDSEEFKNGDNLHLLVHPIWWNEMETDDLKSLENFKAFYMKKFDDNIYRELKSFWDGKKEN